MSVPFLQVRQLSRHYRSGGWLRSGNQIIRAVDDVSFDIAPGETLGLVGESGSGKSTLGRTLLRLEEPSSGTVHFEGSDLAGLDAKELRKARRRMQIVSQDPWGSLNPFRSVGASVADGLRIHHLAAGADVKDRVAELLGEVGLDASMVDRRPHQFSGGQRQRLGIARALAVEPDFMVCDEPVTALDVAVQAQILNLLVELRERRGLAYLFIAHDLAVVRQVAHRIAVMYLGTIVEIGPARSVIANPRHPYTRALVSAAPRFKSTLTGERIVLRGDPPSAASPPPGCPFEPRCFHPLKGEICQALRPALLPVDDRQVACHFESSHPGDP